MQPSPGLSEAYQVIGKRFGTRLSSDEIKSRFRTAFQKYFAPADRPLKTDEARDEGLWKQVVADVLSDVHSTGDCFAALYEHFAQPDSWAVYDDVEPTIVSLAERGYPIIIASNFDKRLHTVCDQIPFLREFPRVISTEVGFNKPAPQFYERIVEVAGVSAQCVLMVGDDQINDVDGACAAGLQAVWLDRDDAGFSRDLRSEQPTGESISSLSDLLARLPGPNNV